MITNKHLLFTLFFITTIQTQTIFNQQDAPFNFEPLKAPQSSRYAIQTQTFPSFNNMDFNTETIPKIQILTSECKQPKQLINNKCICPYILISNGDECVPLFDSTNINGYNLQSINTYGYGSSNGPNIPTTSKPQFNSWRKLLNFTRNINGEGNNLQNYYWGAQNTTLARISPATYQDSQSQPISYRPNPRYISNLFGSASSSPETSQKRSTVLVALWGQFMDHDIDLTPTQNSAFLEYMNISIPIGDQIMDPLDTRRQSMRFIRSKYDQASNPRQQINQVTAWIDASMIYGSDQKTNNNLRLKTNGKLKTSSGEMLPKSTDGFFYGGDIRINQNLPLTSLHTLFLREHNRIAQVIANDDPQLSDDQIFHIARAYVTGIVSKITFDDWLPQILGRGAYQKYIGEYKGYNSSINPSVLNEFSTAAFRVGHSLLPNTFFLLDDKFAKIKDLELKELFFNPSAFYEINFFQNLLRGLTRIKLKKRTCKISDGIRNFLIIDQNKRSEKFDLFSFNIQRGRDHGLPSYGQLQSDLGFRASNSFYEITNPADALKLQNIYNNPRNLDLWLGIICENNVDGSQLGKIGTALIGRMFKTLRDADRLWYQKILPSQLLREIKATTLADVIQRNSKVKNLQSNIFLS